MIVAHPNAIEDLVEFPDFGSVQSLANYAGDVDPASTTLVKPIGVYRFRDMVPCGLKNCHTPHRKGLVVQTGDGYAVNIGNICGKRHFGEHFSALLQAAVRLDQRKSYVSRVRELKAVAGRHQAHMKSLMEAPMGAAWSHHARRKFSEVVPNDAIESLKEMAQRGESSVYAETIIGGEAAEIARLFSARTSYGGGSSMERVQREYKGRLLGLEIWNDDAGRLLYLLEKDLAEFLAVDPINCRTKELRKAADFAVEFEGRLRKVQDVLDAARNFFTAENFARLRYLPGIGESTRTFFESLDWDFQAGKPRGSLAA